MLKKKLRRKSKTRAPAPRDCGISCWDERARVARLASRARELLQPFSSFSHHELKYATRPVEATLIAARLGMMDGLGLLLSIGKFDLDGDGQISDTELAHFHEAAERLIDSTTAYAARPTHSAHYTHTVHTVARWHG